MKQVQLFRVVMFVGCTSLLVGGYFMDLARQAISYERYVAVAFMALLWTGTFFSERLRKHIDWVALVSLSAALYTFCVFLYDTRLDVSGAVSSFGLAFVGCLTMRKPLPIVIWCAAAITSFTVTAYLIENPGMLPISFSVCVLVITVGTTWLVISQVRSVRERDQ